jgi:hypothetical protein
MRDDRSVVQKYLTMLLIWLVPVALMVTAAVRPVEGMTRDLLMLPAIVMLLYAALLLVPLFNPIRNADFFDELPASIERIIDSQRARKDARELIKLYDGDRLPNVYELQKLTRFQKGILHTCEMLKSHTEWHASNAEVSRDLLDRLQELMHADETEEPEPKTPPAKRQKTAKQK